MNTGRLEHYVYANPVLKTLGILGRITRFYICMTELYRNDIVSS